MLKMWFLLLSFVGFCAVSCDDVSNNYYVIEMPEEVRDSKKDFKVYWNVPTMQCKSKKIPFENLYEKYGIIQNDDDQFKGEKITILYEPGFFPAIFKNETSGKYRFRNGGVPQEGSLEEHLTVFKKDIEEFVPDPNFNGIGIIDFESWRPIFRQNFGTLVPYKDVSYEIEKKLHWWWPKNWIQTEARQRFETAARKFMQNTLSIAKQMRPKALWGYYGYPYCFNIAGSNKQENCPANVVGENDVTYWLWLESTALYPSVYSSRDLSTAELGKLVRGRVREAHRVKRYDTPILPYYWFRYRDGGYMKEADLNIVLESLQESKASGFIIWGSSNDVNTVAKCKKLHQYVETVLGPTVAKYIQRINRIDDVIVETPIEINIDDFNVTLPTSEVVTTTHKTIVNETLDTNTTTSLVKKVQIDPEFDWIPPENYSQDISHNVEEELIKKGFNTTSDRKIEIYNLNTTDVDKLFDALLKSEYAKETQQSTRHIQNITEAPIIVNNTDYTAAPKLTSNDTITYVTKEPINFINEISEKEITPNEEVASSLQVTESIIQKEIEIEKMKDNSNLKKAHDTNPYSVHKNKTVFTTSYYSTNNVLSSNESLTTENNMQYKESFHKNNNTDQSDQFKNEHENYIINIIFDTLFNSNNNLKSSKQQTVTELNNIYGTNNAVSESDEQVLKAADTPGNLHTITTIDGVTSTASSETYKVNCDNQDKNSAETSTDLISTTFESTLSSLENEYLDPIFSDDIFYNDANNISAELDDFLIAVTNLTKVDLEMTTENSETTDDLRILTVNMSYPIITTENVTESNFEKVSEYSVEINSEVNNVVSTTEKNIGSESDSFVKQSEEIRSTESDYSDTTTEPTDRVVTYILY